MLRTAPWVGLLTGVLVVWFWRVWQSDVVRLPVRPWYPHKEGLCLADVVRAARRTLSGVSDVEGWARALVGRVERVFEGALAAPKQENFAATEEAPVVMAA